MPTKKKTATTTAKKTDKDGSQPVSPRTPQTTPLAEQTNATADAGGPHKPDEHSKGSATDSKSKKKDLKVFRVRHDGHDGPGFSTVAADTEGRALQLVGDQMIANDLGHTHGRMEAREVTDDSQAGQFNPTSEGVIHFDNGKKA